MADNDTTVQTDTTSGQDSSNDDLQFPDDQATDSQDSKETKAEETKESEAEDTKPEAKAEGDEAKEPTEDSKQEDADKESKEETQDKQETPDQEKARRAYQQRQKTRQQVAARVDQAYGPQSQEDLVNQGMSEADAKIEALRQEMQYRDTRNFVADLNAGLQVDAESVLKELPVYNPDSPEFDAEFAKTVEAQYKQAARFQVDEENGIVTNAEIPLYEFFERMAKIRGAGVSKGSQAGQKNALKMLSKTEAPSSSSQTKSETEDDIFLKGFNRVK